MADLLESLGQGLRMGGAILSPQVYEAQNREKQRVLPNMLLQLQIDEQQRNIQADNIFKAALSKKTATAPLRGASDLTEAMRDIPPELIAASPLAQKMSGMASQQQARIDQAQARYDTLYERQLDREQRAEDQSLNRAQRAQAAQEANDTRREIAQLIDSTRRAGINVKNNGKLTDDAVKNEAWYSIINGKLRPGAVSWGVAGNADREAITNKIAEIATEYNIPPEKLATLGLTNRAKAGALLQLEKQRNAVQAYEKSFVSQINVLDQLSDNVERTASPWFNKPLNELRRSGMGDPNVAEFVAQMRLVQTEAARIIANPNLTGQLTDTARSEIGEIISGNMTPAQIKRVAGRLKADAALRHQALDDQAQKLGSEISGSATPVSAPAPASSSDPLVYKGYKFPSQDALDKFKSAGG